MYLVSMDVHLVLALMLFPLLELLKKTGEEIKVQMCVMHIPIAASKTGTFSGEPGQHSSWKWLSINLWLEGFVRLTVLYPWLNFISFLRIV